MWRGGGVCFGFGGTGVVVVVVIAAVVAVLGGPCSCSSVSFSFLFSFYLSYFFPLSALLFLHRYREHFTTEGTAGRMLLPNRSRLSKASI